MIHNAKSIHHVAVMALVGCLINLCVHRGAIAQTSDSVDVTEPSGIADGTPRIDSMGLLGLRPQGRLTDDQMDRAFDLLRQFYPQQADRIAEMHRNDRGAFERAMRELTSGRQMIALAWLEHREPDLFDLQLEEVHLDRTLDAVLVAAGPERPIDGAQAETVRDIVQKRCDLLIRLRSRQLILLHEHVSHQKEQLQEDASRVSELIEHKHEQFVADAGSDRGARYPSLDVQRTSGIDSETDTLSDMDIESLSMEDRALAILMAIDSRRGERLQALREHNVQRFHEILETTQFGGRMKQLARLQVDQPALFALKMRELNVDRAARYLAYRVHHHHEGDEELRTRVEELINLRIRARGYELVQLEEHLANEMAGLLRDSASYDDWAESQVEAVLSGTTGTDEG